MTSDVLDPAAGSPGQADHRRLALGVLMPGFNGTTVPTWLAPHVSDGLGGVCLFAMNTPDLASTRALCDELSRLNPTLCITVDEEGGDVTRLQRVHGSALPGNEALGAVNDLAVTEQVGAAIGRLVRAAGIHLDLAPCVDVASNPLNPVIGTRSFGADPAQVAAQGAAYLDGLHAAGVGGCAKHFPGHGDTATDSHHGVPVIEVSRALLESRDVAPFAALASRVDAMMTGHIVCSAMGSEPASLSAWAYQWIRDLGFEGPIITDALGMKAVVAGDADHPAGIGEACVRALAAGVDLCCLDSPHNRDEQATFNEALEAVVAALDIGRLDPARLAASAQRVITCVETINARGRDLDLSPAEAQAGLDLLGLQVARSSLVVRGDVAVEGPIVFCDLRNKINLASGLIGSVTVDELNRARGLVGDSAATVVDADAVGEHHDATVIALTRSALADPTERERLDTLLAHRPDAVVIHAGMAQSAPVADRLICSHGLGRAVSQAAAERIVGREVFEA